jgi:hypothetical protein
MQKQETSGAPRPFGNFAEKMIYVLVILVAALLARNGIIDKVTAGTGCAMILLHLFYRMRKRTL